MAKKRNQRPEKRRSLLIDVFGEKPKQTVNSKLKGSVNEREAGKWLERWVGLPFSRVPSSGGLRWSNQPDTIGDLVCQDKNHDNVFTYETKHVKNFDIYRNNSVLKTFWLQASDDAKRAGKKPMMLIRKNGMPKQTYIVGLPISLIFELEFEVLVIFKGFFLVNSDFLLTLDYGQVEEAVRNISDNIWG